MLSPVPPIPSSARCWIAGAAISMGTIGCGLPWPSSSLIAAAALSQAALNWMGRLSWENRRRWNAAETGRTVALLWGLVVGIEALPTGDRILAFLLATATLTAMSTLAANWLQEKVRRLKQRRGHPTITLNE